MIVTIHQPDFLPWLGFFDRWLRSDLYIVLDDVQFIRRGWHHRDQIKTPQGIKWLTVPVVKKGRYSQLVKDVKISNHHNWKEKMLNAVHAAYREAPQYDSVYHEIKEILSKNHTYLIELNIELLKYCARILDIRTPLELSSTFNETSHGTERLVRLVKAVQGDIYLTGLGAKDYLDEKAFAEEDIEVSWQNFQHPVYPQLHGDFKRMLSVIDFLMMVSEPKIVFPN
ncbi:MAG: WbqC family protein [Deltaproteobacteria bacterium]|nr:MAG: WbqC family protein [Deltaproteobacteria bacterium]